MYLGLFPRYEKKISTPSSVFLNAPNCSFLFPDSLLTTFHTAWVWDHGHQKFHALYISASPAATSSCLFIPCIPGSRHTIHETIWSSKKHHSNNLKANDGRNVLHSFWNSQTCLWFINFFAFTSLIIFLAAKPTSSYALELIFPF